jgi:hypothetical protein
MPDENPYAPPRGELKWETGSENRRVRPAREVLHEGVGRLRFLAVAGGGTALLFFLGGALAGSWIVAGGGGVLLGWALWLNRKSQAVKQLLIRGGQWDEALARDVFRKGEGRFFTLILQAVFLFLALTVVVLAMAKL